MRMRMRAPQDAPAGGITQGYRQRKLAVDGKVVDLRRLGDSWQLDFRGGRGRGRGGGGRAGAL